MPPAGRRMRRLASSVDSARMHTPDGPARGHSYARGLRGLTTRPRPHPPPLHNADSPSRNRTTGAGAPLTSYYHRPPCPLRPPCLPPRSLLEQSPPPAPRPPQPVRAPPGPSALSARQPRPGLPPVAPQGTSGKRLRDLRVAGLRGRTGRAPNELFCTCLVPRSRLLNRVRNRRSGVTARRELPRPVHRALWAAPPRTTRRDPLPGRLGRQARCGPCPHRRRRSRRRTVRRRRGPGGAGRC